jgi:hypothetical protein
LQDILVMLSRNHEMGIGTEDSFDQGTANTGVKTSQMDDGCLTHIFVQRTNLHQFVHQRELCDFKKENISIGKCETQLE